MNLTEEKGGVFLPIRGESRGATYSRFVRGLEQHPGDLCILLVDSEEPGTSTEELWQHVKMRRGDLWDKPAAAGEERLYFMVPMVEAWLISDPEKLEEAIGRCFDADKLPRGGLENRSKDAINAALAHATRNCPKEKQYSKKTHGRANALIGVIRPEKVKSLPHGKRLFREVRKLLEPPTIEGEQASA